MASPHGKYRPAYCFTEVLISLLVSTLLLSALFYAVHLSFKQSLAQSEALDQQIDLIHLYSFLKHNPPIGVTEPNTLQLKRGFLFLDKKNQLIYEREVLIEYLKSWVLDLQARLICITVNFPSGQPIVLKFAR